MSANFLNKNKLLFTLLGEAKLNTSSTAHRNFLFACLKVMLAVIINPKNYNIFKTIIINRINSNNILLRISDFSNRYISEEARTLEEDLTVLSYEDFFIKHKKICLDIIYFIMYSNQTPISNIEETFQNVALEILKDSNLQLALIQYHRRASNNHIYPVSSLKDYPIENYASNLYYYLKYNKSILQQLMH